MIRLLGIVFLDLLVLVTVARTLRWFFLPKPVRSVEAPAQCVCGYPLKKLALPRCPECGRVHGFDHSAEELGLSVDELTRIKEAQERRARQQ